MLARHMHSLDISSISMRFQVTDLQDGADANPIRLFPTSHQAKHAPELSVHVPHSRKQAT